MYAMRWEPAQKDTSVVISQKAAKIVFKQNKLNIGDFQDDLYDERILCRFTIKPLALVLGTVDFKKKEFKLHCFDLKIKR